MVFLFVLQMLPVSQVLGQELCESPCEFRFAVYGDSRSDHDIHRDIVSRLVAAKPQLILTTGDVVEGWLSFEESWKKQWGTYDEIVKGFKKENKNISVYPAVGNHDIFADRWATDQYEKRVSKLFDPPTDPALRPGKTPFYYAFDKGNIRFIPSIVSGRAN